MSPPALKLKAFEIDQAVRDLSYAPCSFAKGTRDEARGTRLAG
jgi:hypothetical protein